MGTNRALLAGATAAAITLALTVAAPLSADAAAAKPGSAGGGDPYFPRQGNGGYQVGHYDLQISYTPKTKHLTGLATISARATQALSRFDLDLRRNLHVSSVLVDGHAAKHSQPAALKQELVVTPAHALAKGHRFKVVVRYGGTAKPITDPDGSLDGFITTNDGAFVASEPQGSPTWFPANDIPRDKATFAVAITVPKGLTAVSNGALVRKLTIGNQTRWQWLLKQPVSTYLVTATLGKFNVSTGRTPGGVPYFTAVDPSQQKKAAPVLKKLPAIIDYFSKVYGKYPFGQVGAIVDNAPNVGYALETATRPVFDRAPDIQTLSHELAHQWFGDDVTVYHWPSIWLNEGFAEFSSWLWDEHRGAETAAQHLRALLAHPASDTAEWLPPPAATGSADQIFAGSVYDRGAGTLEALRQKVGSATFFKIMRGWLVKHRYGNATVGQFTAYAAKVSHRNLGHFFYEWLTKKGKPSA
jgi:aminopeptidase N